MTGGRLYTTDIAEKLPKDVENSISVIEFEIKRKRKDMNAVMAKTEPSENERIKIGRETDFITNIERLIKAFRNTFHANLGRIPPSDIDLEKDIIGALMLHSVEGQDSQLGKGIGPPAITQVQSFLLPEHFYVEAHKEIYTAILDLYKHQMPFDMTAVKNHLRKAGKMELVGGAHYLVACTSGVSSSASLDYHSRILVEFAMKRQLILACSEGLRNLYDDTNDVFEIKESIQESINETDSWIRQ